MISIDFRDATYTKLAGQLTGLREAVYRGWVNHGPCTTRQLAERIGVDLLTVRPRTTELLQLGLIECADAGPASEGAYRARSAAEVEQWITQRRVEQETKQFALL